ncbi:MAG: serine protease [Verrucomicrobia subdivision 3 bacterium]|nr:serine protease [Limisphaerales bacterium]
MMPGVQVEEIWKALCTGYAKNSLRQMLRCRLNIDLDDIVGDGPMKDMTFNLLDAAEREGWEVDLVREAYRYNPRNPDLMRVYQKYGFSVAADVQQSGARLTAGEQPVTDLNFEVTVNANLPPFDVVAWRENMLDMEGRVCRVELNNGTPRKGTGFLVGPDAVLTNYHVMQPIIDDVGKAAAVILRFDYKKLRNGQDSWGVPAKLHADWLIDHSKFSPAEKQGKTPDIPPPTPDELDYTLVRLSERLGDAPIKSEAPASPRRGWVRVPDGGPPLSPDMPLVILQHPNCAPLKMALDTKALMALNANGTRVKYATNTEPGSSGSPCFDLNWNLVALHHYGDAAFGHPPYNQGIPIAAIRQRLGEKAEALGGDLPQ